MNLRTVVSALFCAVLLALGGTARGDTPLDVTYTFSAIPGSPDGNTPNTTAADVNWTTDPYPADVPTAQGVTFSPFSLEDPNTRLGQSQQTPGAFTYGRGMGQTFVVTITPMPGQRLTITDITFDGIVTLTRNSGGYPVYGPDPFGPCPYFGFQVGAQIGLPDLTGVTHLNAPLIGSALGGILSTNDVIPLAHRSWWDGNNPPLLQSSQRPSGDPKLPFLPPDAQHPADTFSISYGGTGNLMIHLTDPLFSNISSPITFAIYKPYADSRDVIFSGIGPLDHTYFPTVGIDNFRIQGTVEPHNTELLLIIR